MAEANGTTTKGSVALAAGRALLIAAFVLIAFFMTWHGHLHQILAKSASVIGLLSALCWGLGSVDVPNETANKWYNAFAAVWASAAVGLTYPG